MEQNQSGVCQQRLLAGGGCCHKQSLSAVFTTFSWRVHISNSNTGSGVSRATGGQPSAGPEAVRSSRNRLPSAATGGSASSLLPLASSWSSPAGLDFKLLGNQPGMDPLDPRKLVPERRTGSQTTVGLSSHPGRVRPVTPSGLNPLWPAQTSVC